MKLSQKNLFYTILITAVLSILVVGYFVFMLPSLYVSYMQDKNYDIICNQHNRYLKERSYENITVRNPGSMTMELGFDEEDLLITGKAFQFKVKPDTAEAKALFADIKDYVKKQLDDFGNGDNKEFKLSKKDFDKKVKDWSEQAKSMMDWQQDLPIQVRAQLTDQGKNLYRNEFSKIHVLSKDTLIIESGIQDGENHYSNYMGVTYRDNRLVVSYYAAMTPQMNEVRPIVLHSLPMLLCVIVLFAMIVSSLYSRGIVNPILELVREKEAEKYKELEIQNQRQEVFLKASSHQLKTPISAAMLLVDGMSNEIGKYQDTKTYLPEVKKQLLSMKTIVEEILSLSRQEGNLSRDLFLVNDQINQMIQSNQAFLLEKNIKIHWNPTEEVKVHTDGIIFYKMLDNLFSNAIRYTKKGGWIRITLSESKIMIENGPAHIEEALLNNIFEPFVSSNGSGHGLGLYIVAYYASLLKTDVQIYNQESGVCACLDLSNLHEIFI